MIAMRMVALLIAMQTTRASDMGTMIAMRNAVILIAAATQTLGLGTCNQSTYCDTVADCDAGCEECYQPEKGLAWCTMALRDGLDYNLTFTNDADMDADVSACRCGRGTGECEDLGVVKKNDAHFSIGVHGGNYGSAYQMKHFRLAAEKGHAKAELSLGHYFEAGLCVERDLDEARRLYSSASARGLAIAQKCVDRLDRGEPLGVDDVLDSLAGGDSGCRM